MLSTAVIVFREVLEAALIITLMLAATRGMQRRVQWTLSGLLLGLTGAGLLAFFADRISSALAGTGQELLNASILFIAVGMLGWHLIWMRRHGQQLTAQIRRVGAAVASGEQAPTALMIIVGLSVLREGSELVLFLYGIAASGSTGMLTGSLIGLSGGILIGVVLYFGLLRIPVQQLFRVTGWLILLLASGLAAQAVGFLVQADVLPPLGNQIWDSSHLLSQQSLLGQFLHITLGYLDQPMGVQLLAYAMTLITILFLSRQVNSASPIRMPSTRLAALPLIFFGLSSYSDPAHADHKVYSPYVEEGELELELRTHQTRDSDPNKNNQETTKLEFGYGVNSKWFTTLVAEYEKSTTESRHHSATAWENRIQLTEAGQYWVDVGLYLEYEHPSDPESADALEAKLLLEKTVDHFVHTANLVLAREIGSHSSSATQFEYAWRSQYLYKPQINPGFEVYGIMGEVGHVLPAAQQDHRIGPVIYGTFKDNHQHKWRYELGYLVGISDAAPSGTIKAMAELEFH